MHFCIAKRQLQQWNVPTHGGRQSTKFQPFVTRGLTCSLKRMKRGANHVHVPSTCTVHRAQHVQCASQITFLFIVILPLSSCGNVPSLVSLAQKFTNSEDPTFKSFTPLARAASDVHCRSPKRIEPSHCGYRPTKFEFRASIGFACSLD